MGYYVIGIGGTGAKCLESLIHLASAGMMPDNSDLHILFVDPDDANGSRARVQRMLSHHKQCKEHLMLGQTPLLKTRISSIDATGNSMHWTPFTDNAQPNLADFFNYNTLNESRDSTHAAAARLFQVLYSPAERTTTLEKGFHGHPSIGSAIMAQTVNFREEEPWSEFRARIANDNNAKVFLAGSIFGGTGASGFPTIAQLVQEELDVNLGGALVLPYFKFTPRMDSDGNASGNDVNRQTNTLKAKSEHFLMNTQAALKYYYLSDQTGVYRAIYLLGNQAQVEVENFLGGKEQKNAPHFIELFAALAAIHFFSNDFEGSQYFLTAREKENTLQWTDLPDGKNGNTIQARIAQLTRFAFAYLHVYRPTLQEIRDKKRDSKSASWFADFFRTPSLLKRRNSDKIDFGATETENLLNYVAGYCQDFLCWLANIQANTGEGENINLIKYRAFAKNTLGDEILKPVEDFDSHQFGDLIQNRSYGDLHTLWSNMCAGKAQTGDAHGIGKLLSALYQNCG